jgi:4-amino-4-deoxychorismate lyase
MSLLFETILIENREAVNLSYHEKRMNSARYHFWQSTPIKLIEQLPLDIPAERLRCRIEFNEEINSITISPFHTREVKSLQIVYSDEIEYSYKYCNREELAQLFSQKKLADDILIIKSGLVTDTYMANIVFTDGEKNYTPASSLLNGTRRGSLIDAQIIKEAEIKETDLDKFSAWQHINALNPFDERRFISMESILR